MPVLVDAYDSWGNYRGTVAVDTVQDQDARKVGGCLGIVFGFFLVFLIQGLVSFIPLVLRVFMNPEVAKIHAKRSRKLFIAGIFVVLFYLVAEQLGLGKTPDSTGGFIKEEALMDTSAILNAAYFIFGMGIFAQLISFVHQIIASIYPDKVSGNGYGLIALVALIPGIRPNKLMTVLSDWGPPLGLLALIMISQILEPTPESNLLMTFIYMVIGLAIIFGLPIWYLASADEEFNEDHIEVPELAPAE